MNQDVELKDWEKLELEVLQESVFTENLLAHLKKSIVGQEALLERLLIGLFGNGHLLLEGVPGLAKTLAVKTLATTINAKFNRIQFTPDVLPADILGTTIFNMQTNEFSVKKGPVFTNFVLADEINRAPEKVQSALLEVMQEKQVTIGNTTYPIAPPFLVLATQNPLDQGGTYELPEAQMDRFMMKVIIDYPSLEEERLIIRDNIEMKELVADKSFSIEEVFKVQNLVRKIFIDKKIEDYILSLIFCTRYPEKYNLPQLKQYLRFGSSPRGSINLVVAAKAHAFLRKRAYVVPDDVKAIAADVLRHRIGLSYSAKAENLSADDLLEQIIASVPVP